MLQSESRAETPRSSAFQCRVIHCLHGYAHGAAARLPVRRAVEQAAVPVHACEVPCDAFLPVHGRTVCPAERVVFRAAGRRDLSASLAGEDEASVAFRCLVPSVGPCGAGVCLPAYRYAGREAVDVESAYLDVWRAVADCHRPVGRGDYRAVCL